jgi:hypothetical protein
VWRNGKLVSITAYRQSHNWRHAQSCYFDIQVFKLYRMNKIMAWYQICKQHGIIKDIRRYVLPLLEEEFCMGLAGKYSSYLSPLQSFELFQSSQLEPDISRQILHVSYQTFDERYTWVLVFGPILLLYILFTYLIVERALTQKTQLIPTFLP